jgi:hypothetical protein
VLSTELTKCADCHGFLRCFQFWVISVLAGWFVDDMDKLAWEWKSRKFWNLYCISALQFSMGMFFISDTVL